MTRFILVLFLYGWLLRLRLIRQDIQLRFHGNIPPETHCRIRKIITVHLFASRLEINLLALS